MDPGDVSLMDSLTLELKISKKMKIIIASRIELALQEELTKILGDKLKLNK